MNSFNTLPELSEGFFFLKPQASQLHSLEFSEQREH